MSLRVHTSAIQEEGWPKETPEPRQLAGTEDAINTKLSFNNRNDLLVFYTARSSELYVQKLNPYTGIRAWAGGGKKIGNTLADVDLSDPSQISRGKNFNVIKINAHTTKKPLNFVIWTEQNSPNTFKINQLAISDNNIIGSSLYVIEEQASTTIFPLVKKISDTSRGYIIIYTIKTASGMEQIVMKHIMPFVSPADPVLPAPESNGGDNRRITIYDIPSGFSINEVDAALNNGGFFAYISWVLHDNVNNEKTIYCRRIGLDQERSWSTAFNVTQYVSGGVKGGDTIYGIDFAVAERNNMSREGGPVFTFISGDNNKLKIQMIADSKEYLPRLMLEREGLVIDTDSNNKSDPHIRYYRFQGHNLREDSVIVTYLKEDPNLHIFTKSYQILPDQNNTFKLEQKWLSADPRITQSAVNRSQIVAVNYPDSIKDGPAIIYAWQDEANNHVLIQKLNIIDGRKEWNNPSVVSGNNMPGGNIATTRMAYSSLKAGDHITSVHTFLSVALRNPDSLYISSIFDNGKIRGPLKRPVAADATYDPNEHVSAISWRHFPSAADSFIISRYNVETQSGIAQWETDLATGRSESFVDPDIRELASYLYSVSARIYDYTSIDETDSQVVTTHLLRPTDLTAELTDTNLLSIPSIALTWQDNSDVEDGYIIERKEEGGAGFDEIEIITGGMNTYIDNNAAAGTGYTYRVRALKLREGAPVKSTPSNEATILVGDTGNQTAQNSGSATGAALSNGIIPVSGSRKSICFIATMASGTYQSTLVKLLCNERDANIKYTICGRLFITIYETTAQKPALTTFKQTMAFCLTTAIIIFLAVLRGGRY